MKQSKADKIINWILRQGCKETPSRSKYRQFTRPGHEQGYFYFVGKNGALRTGKSASNSISLSHLIIIK